MPTEPSGDNIGCAPSSLRSKIERRRCASTAFGQVFTPSPSGPRRVSVASMRPTRFFASSRFPAPTKPAMPHILKIVFSHEKAQIYFSSAARPKLAPKLQNQQQPNIRGRLDRTVLRPRHEVADVVETNGGTILLSRPVNTSVTNPLTGTGNSSPTFVGHSARDRVFRGDVRREFLCLNE